jgi:hypothetical protein
MTYKIRRLAFPIRIFSNILKLQGIPECIPTYEEHGFLDYNAVWFGESPMFWRNISPPFLGSKSKPSKKPAEAGGKMEKKHVTLKCRALPKLHSVTTQKTVLFIITTMETSNPTYTNRWLCDRCILNICLLCQNIFWCSQWGIQYLLLCLYLGRSYLCLIVV